MDHTVINEVSRIPTVEQPESEQSPCGGRGLIRCIGHGAWRVLRYLLHRVWFSARFALLAYGLLFVALLGFGQGQFASFAHFISFHPEFGVGLRVAFVGLWILLFLIRASSDFFEYLDDLADRSKTANIVLSTVWISCSVLFLGFVSYGILHGESHSPSVKNLMPQPVAIHPQDQAMLRFESVQKAPPFRKGAPTPEIVVADTIEGHATIRKLGPGRYLVQMQPAALADQKARKPSTAPRD
jgi:hypothetical protein